MNNRSRGNPLREWCTMDAPKGTAQMKTSLPADMAGGDVRCKQFSDG